MSIKNRRLREHDAGNFGKPLTRARKMTPLFRFQKEYPNHSENDLWFTSEGKIKGKINQDSRRQKNNRRENK